MAGHPLHSGAFHLARARKFRPDRNRTRSWSRNRNLNQCMCTWPRQTIRAANGVSIRAELNQIHMQMQMQMQMQFEGLWILGRKCCSRPACGAGQTGRVISARLFGYFQNRAQLRVRWRGRTRSHWPQFRSLKEFFLNFIILCASGYAVDLDLQTVLKI